MEQSLQVGCLLILDCSLSDIICNASEHFPASFFNPFHFLLRIRIMAHLLLIIKSGEGIELKMNKKRSDSGS